VAKRLPYGSGEFLWRTVVEASWIPCRDLVETTPVYRPIPLSPFASFNALVRQRARCAAVPRVPGCA